MKCAREGCENELSADRGNRARFCKGAECTRIRRLAIKTRYMAKHTGEKGDLHTPRLCAGPGCTKSFVPSRSDQIYCLDINCYRRRECEKKHRQSARRQEQKQEQLRGLLFHAVPLQQNAALQMEDTMRVSVQAALDAAKIRLIETQAVIQALTQLLHPQEMMRTPAGPGSSAGGPRAGTRADPSAARRPEVCPRREDEPGDLDGQRSVDARCSCGE